LSVARLRRAVRQRTLGREFFQTRGLSEVWFVRTRLCQHLGQVRARIDLFPVIASIASGLGFFAPYRKLNVCSMAHRVSRMGGVT
jgi:hypothetical protein